MVDKVEKLVQAMRVAVRDQAGKTTPVSTGAVAPPHAVEAQLHVLRHEAKAK